MNNIINTLEIKNFKSIKHINTDCKRVNVFIGKPNVGKSNILEAISILGEENVRLFNTENRFLNSIIRYEEFSNLFYDDDYKNNIEILTDKISAFIKAYPNRSDFLFLSGTKIPFDLKDKPSSTDTYNAFNNYHSVIDDHLTLHIIYEDGKIGNTQTSPRFSNYSSPVKKYDFKHIKLKSNHFPNFLTPPHGDNLFNIIDQNKSLRSEISEIFKGYGLNFVGYKKESTFEIEKSTDGYVNKYHYSSVADTFQRLIFYFAAIDSNENSVLILEEPEVHSFPPYTKELSDRIIDSKTNQFFITTHSPYLLHNLVENLDSSELNLYITYYENYQTKIKLLNKEELRKVADFSIDLFFNLNEFVPNA